MIVRNRATETGMRGPLDFHPNIHRNCFRHSSYLTSRQPTTNGNTVSSRPRIRTTNVSSHVVVASLDACLFMLSLAATRRVSAAAGKRKPERERRVVCKCMATVMLLFFCVLDTLCLLVVCCETVYRRRGPSIGSHSGGGDGLLLLHNPNSCHGYAGVIDSSWAAVAHAQGR